jgi:hypothetical protein
MYVGLFLATVQLKNVILLFDFLRINRQLPFFLSKIFTQSNHLPQVEELQWRIKHNLELPATQIFSPGSPMSLDDTNWTELNSGNQTLTMLYSNAGSEHLFHYFNKFSLQSLIVS